MFWVFVLVGVFVFPSGLLHGFVFRGALIFFLSVDMHSTVSRFFKLCFFTHFSVFHFCSECYSLGYPELWCITLSKILSAGGVTALCRNTHQCLNETATVKYLEDYRVKCN